MSITLNDIINYGSCKFKVVKFATSEDVNYLLNNSFFIGMIVPYCGNNSIPNGYLICDGSAISRMTYVDLFNVIGTTYGVGDESTTFNIPNLVDKFIEGSTISGETLNAGLPNIKGTFKLTADQVWCDPSNWTGTGAIKEEPTANYQFMSPYNWTGGEPRFNLIFNASFYNNIYSDSITTVQPPAIKIRFLIKAFNA